MNVIHKSLTLTSFIVMMAFSGCFGEESSDVEKVEKDCQIVPEGEYRTYFDTGLSGHVLVLESVQVTEEFNRFWSDYMGECMIVTQVSVMKNVNNVTYGPYTMFDENGQVFTDHRVITGSSSNPSVVFFMGTESGFVYLKSTGEYNENGSISWTATDPYGTISNYTWVPCDQCFVEESIGTYNISTQLFTDLDGTSSYSDYDGDGIPDHLDTITNDNQTNSTENSENELVGTTCENDTDLRTLTSGISQFNLTQQIDGVVENRSFFVHVPKEFNASKCYPILYALHGNGGVPQDFFNFFGPLVDEGHVISVYPSGWKQSWNLGKEDSTADDVQFINHISEYLANFSNLDEERRYLFGNSNGAGLAQKLAIETHLFRAFVSEVTMLTEANLPNNNSSNPAVMQILGADDPLVPYEGGEGVGGHIFLSGNESAPIWATHNECNSSQNFTLSDGTMQTIYGDCKNGMSVVNYIVANAGHGIPPDFRGDKARYIWDFFMNH